MSLFIPLLLVGIVQISGAWFCFRLARNGIFGAIFATLVGAGVFLLQIDFRPPYVVLFSFVMLAVAGLFCLEFSRMGAGRFFLWAWLVYLISVTLVGFFGQQQYAALQRRFPFQSLAERLAYETAAGHASDAATDALPSAAALAELDQRYDWPRNRREESLRLVHASAWTQFVSAEDFGPDRYGPSPRVAVSGGQRPLIRVPTIDLPVAGTADSPTEQPDKSAQALASLPAGDWPESVHRHTIADFVNDDGWGVVVDRHRIAGFESHGFGRVPIEPVGHCEVDWHPPLKGMRVELVSLLKQDLPGVYVSEYFPNMDQLRGAPLRELDEFEQRSLAKLEQGGEIEVEAVGPRVRMLGAIRVARQCLACHQVEHGALMGAFSYTLLPADPPPTEPAATSSPSDDSQN